MLPRLFLTILPVYSPSVPEKNDDNRFLFEMAFNKNINSNTLSFYGKQLKLDTESEIAPVVKLIEDHPNLEVLDFRGNTLSVLAGQRIARALSGHRELKECIWGDMFTGRLKNEIPLVLDSLGAALTASGCRLTTLDLSDNAFGAGLSDSLYRFLQSPALYSLENLIMNNNGLGLAGVTVGEALSDLHRESVKNGETLRLKKFVCGRNRLEIASSISLTSAFVLIKTLEEVHMPQNGISGDGIMALAQSFASNPNLRVIDLNDNLCKSDGAVEIAEILPLLTKLEVLNLGDCVCEDEGVIAILGGLESCSKLQRVVFSGNSISADIVEEIGEFFSRAEFCHVHVDMSVNALGKYFDRAVEQYSTTTKIDFGQREDDEILAGESDEEGAEDASMESMDDDANTSRETVIDRSQHEDHNTSKSRGDTNELLNQMLTVGFGCMKITGDKKKATAGIVSFLDRSLKLDNAASASEVVKAIRQAPSMRGLELRGNTLGKDAGDAIAAAMECHPELEICLWSDLFTGRLKNEIPPILESLGRSMIKAGCKIRELDLSDNAFGPIGADALKEFLESPSAYSLEALLLNNNGLGVGGKQIAKSLTECLHRSIAAGGETRLRLKTFIAGRNRLENPGAHALAATFKELGTLEWFDVRQNGIHEEGIRALVASLKHNHNLRNLCLEDNTMLPKGAKALAKTLESWPKLESLNISDCLIRDAGCNYVIDHLNPALHRQLKNVYLCGNELTPPTAKMIIQKWSKFDGFNPKPVLHIHTNSFGDEFDEVSKMAPENVNVGDEMDDLGSLDGDAEEYNSKSSSDDADRESEGDDVDSDDSDDSVQEIDVTTSQEVVLKAALDYIDKLNIDFESRFQEETAKAILQLTRPLQSCNMSAQALARAVDVAEDIVVRVAAVKRNPIAATTQLINNIVAQCAGTGVKPEFDWGYNAKPEIIARLLQELVARGHFKHEKALIQKFFPSVV